MILSQPQVGRIRDCSRCEGNGSERSADHEQYHHATHSSRCNRSMRLGAVELVVFDAPLFTRQSSMRGKTALSAF